MNFGMTKVYPNAAAATASPSLPSPCSGSDPESSESVVLTVWKKSLIFNCDGFTVFDADGNLVYRVDNYMSGKNGEIVLMDASGTCLLTIRRKRLSLSDSWTVFDGETADNPRFSVRKNVNPLKSKCIAYVSGGGGKMYEVEGSYSRRCCAVYDEKKRRVAEIKQKEASVKGVAFGGDVFRLVVNPGGIDTAAAMAVVILLDQMYASSRFLLP